MKPRTLIALLLALVVGVVASIATYDLIRREPRPAHAQSRAQSEDSDPGLTP